VSLSNVNKSWPGRTMGPGAFVLVLDTACACLGLLSQAAGQSGNIGASHTLRRPADLWTLSLFNLQTARPDTASSTSRQNQTDGLANSDMRTACVRCSDLHPHLRAPVTLLRSQRAAQPTRSRQPAPSQCRFQSTSTSCNHFVDSSMAPKPTIICLIHVACSC
jgi:hypothetical protein